VLHVACLGNAHQSLRTQDVNRMDGAMQPSHASREMHDGVAALDGPCESNSASEIRPRITPVSAHHSHLHTRHPEAWNELTP